MLALALTMCAACLRPSFEVDPQLNVPLWVDFSLLNPPQGKSSLDLCNDGEPPDDIEFFVQPALDSFDGDTIEACWFEGTRVLSTGSAIDFVYNTCAQVRLGSFGPGKELQFRVVLSDRDLTCNADGVSAADDATFVELRWFVAASEVEQCCPE